MLNETNIEKFKESLRGELIQRSDERYEEARKLYNGMIEKRPHLIARCVDAADVITAVNFGRDQSLLIAIRGGGHNGPGLGSCNDGLVIDLSMMKSVRVDPASGTVRVDAGCTSGDVDHATHAFGLAVPFGIVSPLAAAQGTSRASTASRSTTCSKRTLSWPTVVLSRPTRASIRIFSGPSVAVAATLAS